VLAAGLLFAPGIARAGENARFLNAPSTAASPAPRIAVQYELQLQLPQGRGLARLLMDAGVDREDAAAAARLAAGHLGDGDGGCEAKVSVSRPFGGGGLRLDRVTLFTQADQTVIEWREGGLAIASKAALRKSPRLI
jgi:hypothetical protein